MIQAPVTGALEEIRYAVIYQNVSFFNSWTSGSDAAAETEGGFKECVFRAEERHWQGAGLDAASCLPCETSQPVAHSTVRVSMTDLQDLPLEVKDGTYLRQSPWSLI